MSIARRTLLTTTAAGTLLCALWFVPSANATGDAGVRDGSTGSSATSSGEIREASATADFASGERLAETGAGIDTTPYLIGGTAFLCVGAGFVVYAARRGSTAALGL